MVQNDLGYTGLLEEGSRHVIMRLSQTANLIKGADGLTPSIALKFLTDGPASQNIFGMQSLLSSKQWNFFQPQMSNRLKKFDPKAN